jgi:hypothetical protein
MSFFHALMGAGRVAFPAVYDPMAGTPNGTYSDSTFDNPFVHYLYVKRDGTWVITVPFPDKTGNWAVTPSATVGDLMYVKFTRTAYTVTSPADGASATDTTSWLSLSADRNVAVNSGSGAGTNYTEADATYTVEIATDAAGANIVSTTTGIRIVCGHQWTE